MRVPSPCGSDEGFENRTRVRIIIGTAFRMPLHTKDEVIVRSTLDCFNDVVFRAPGDNPQLVAGSFQCLMVARVGRDHR